MLSLLPPSRSGLLLIVVAATAVRLYGISAPLTDAGHERQTQVAMVARNLHRDSLNLFYPRLDMFAPTRGYAALEFPFQPAVIGLLYNATGGVDDRVGRAVTIGFSIASIWLFYEVTSMLLPPVPSLFATVVYSFSPLGVYFGRAVFPDVPALAFSLASLVLMLRWETAGRTWMFWASAVLAALAALAKAPPGLVMLLPLVALVRKRAGERWLMWPPLYLYVSVVMIPNIAWAIWANQISSLGPEWNPYQASAIDRWGIPGAWYRPDVYVFVSTSLFFFALTPAASVFAAVGLGAALRHDYSRFFIGWFLALLAYVFLTPGASATHWNYHVPLLPLGSLFAGLGLSKLLDLPGARRRSLVKLSVAGLLVGYVVLYAAVVSRAYNADDRVPFAREVGAIIRQQAPAKGFLLLVHPGMVATTQVYYMDRPVRPLPESANAKLTVAELEKWRRLGAQGLVAVDTPYGSGTAMVRNDQSIRDYLARTYQLSHDAEHYAIYLPRVRDKENKP